MGYIVAVCVQCQREREAGDFPRTPQGKRRKVCNFCLEEKAQPVACSGCGALTELDDFPKRRNGRRSLRCSTCHAAPHRPRPCAGCGETKPVSEFHCYNPDNGSFSRTCNACRRPLLTDRPCMRCQKVLSHHAFHRYKNGTVARSCHDCRRVRPNGPPGLNKAPHDCKVCGKEIWRDEPPSRLLKRKCCSYECETASRRRNNRTCLRCKRVLPFDAFDQNTHGRNRKSSCKECIGADTSVVNGDFVLRPTVPQLRAKLRRYANSAVTKFSVTLPQARKLHSSPCELCGKAVSGVVLRDPAEGYTAANCRPVCRICRRILNVVTFSELLLLGNEIAAHSPIDLAKEGWVRCRNTKPRASKSCEPSTG